MQTVSGGQRPENKVAASLCHGVSYAAHPCFFICSTGANIVIYESSAIALAHCIHIHGSAATPYFQSSYARGGTKVMMIRCPDWGELHGEHQTLLNGVLRLQESGLQAVNAANTVSLHFNLKIGLCSYYYVWCWAVKHGAHRCFNGELPCVMLAHLWTSAEPRKPTHVRFCQPASTRESANEWHCSLVLSQIASHP